ncbi:hypothetical protein ACFCP7_27615, partial [Paenibacillus elgii]
MTLNLYTYMGNNPLRYVDPTGHEAAPALDWGVVKKEGLRVIEGGAKGAKQGNKGSIWGTIVGGFVGALLEPNPTGESQADINSMKARDLQQPIIETAQLEKLKK